MHAPAPTNPYLIKLRTAEHNRELILEKITDTEASQRLINEAMPDIEELIKAAASRININLTGVAVQPGSWPDVLYQLSPPHMDGARYNVAQPDPFCLMCAVDAPAVRKWLKTKLEQSYSSLPAVLGADQKARVLADLKAQLVNIEREIADVFWEADAQSITLPVPSINGAVLIGLA